MAWLLKASHIGQISAGKVLLRLAKSLLTKTGVEDRATAAIQMATKLQDGCVPAR